MGMVTMKISQVLHTFGAAKFHHVTAHSFGTYEPFISSIFTFFGGCSKPRILNQQIWGYTCIKKFHILQRAYLYVFYTAQSREQLYPSTSLIAQPVQWKYNVLTVRQEINLK
jgi:hypothetical protein